MRRALLASTSVLLLACPAPTPGPDGGTGGGDATGGGSAMGGGMTGGGAAQQRDLDIAVVKLTTTGALDPSFGTQGRTVIDLGQASAAARDSVWSLDLDAMGRAVLFGSTKSSTGADVDRFVTRLTVAGAVDTSFGVQGYARLDQSGGNDTARHGFVQADGKILASGYTSLPTGATTADGGMQSANHVVLQRLDSSGAPDSTFGTAGVVRHNPFTPIAPVTLWGMAEAYAVVPQSGGRSVTVGYGRQAASGPVDVVSFRYDNAGAVDGTWATAGKFVFDLIGADERGRTGLSLPDDRVVMVGSATPLSNNVDALVLITTPAGVRDATFDGDGVQTFSFDRADEAFWGVAVNAGATVLAAAGFRTGPGNTATENDDAVLALIPLTAGPAAFAQAVPLATDAHDRFLSVAFDGSKVVAAGWVREGDDTKMAVARFNLDGTRDTTFGTGGLVTLNVATGTGLEEAARAVKVLPDGSILVAGVIEH